MAAKKTRSPEKQAEYNAARRVENPTPRRERNKSFTIIPAQPWSKARLAVGIAQGGEKGCYLGDYKEHVLFPAPLAPFLQDASLLPKRPPLNARVRGAGSHEKD